MGATEWADQQFPRAWAAIFLPFFGHESNEFPGRFSYESGTSSLYAFLLAARPKRVHIPNYICETIPYALEKAGIPTQKYAVEADFTIAYPDRLAAGEYFLVPDYFGLSADLVHDTLRRVPPERVIVDCAQAYFADYPDAVARIYSPRKFLPVADGGFVATRMDLASEPGDEQAAIANYQYLLRRTVAPVEVTRPLYLEAEERMDDLSLRAMSAFTQNIIRTLDQDFIKSRRRDNYRILEELGGINRLNLRLGAQTPLYYPLMTPHAEKIWQALLDLHIYTPRYWPNVEPRSDFEQALLHETLFLPIDHRYDAAAMVFLKDTVGQMHQRFSH